MIHASSQTNIILQESTLCPINALSLLLNRSLCSPNNGTFCYHKYLIPLPILLYVCANYGHSFKESFYSILSNPLSSVNEMMTL